MRIETSIDTFGTNINKRLIHDAIHLSQTAHIKLAEALYTKILPNLK